MADATAAESNSTQLGAVFIMLAVNSRLPCWDTVHASMAGSPPSAGNEIPRRRRRAKGTKLGARIDR
jgi:hypothetical protein